MKIGRLILRTVVGGYFFGHGTQKLFGWFGGYGPDATGQFFESLGLRPGKRNAIAAGAAEAGGGALLVLGAATPLASAALIATMLTAIHRVHLKNGPWVTDQGYEYNLVLIAGPPPWPRPVPDRRRSMTRAAADVRPEVGPDRPAARRAGLRRRPRRRRGRSRC